MRSKAHIKSHPIHPILVAFPIAFLVGAFVVDAYQYLANGTLTNTGAYLGIAGIVTGLLAAVPGIIDFIYVIPPKSSGKTRGAKHGILNTVVLFLFGAAIMVRDNDGQELTVLGIELVGVLLLTISGWLGGTLVYRNQIGVDIRYADAGKWKEEDVEEQQGRTQVATTAELKVNQMKLIRLGDKRIVLARTETEWVAFDDRCPHRGGSLAGGSIICGTVQCPWHGSQFDVRNGQVNAGPAKEGIPVYKTDIEGDKIFIVL